jgi:hypothetical protein
MSSWCQIGLSREPFETVSNRSQAFASDWFETVRNRFELINTSTQDMSPHIQQIVSNSSKPFRTVH